MKKLILSLAIVAMVGVSHAAFNLANNGDFSAGSSGWGFAGAGASPTFPGAGGNPGAFATIDQTAGGWGGVLFTDVPNAQSLASVGLTAGNSYVFSLDMIMLSGSGVTSGMKMESWNGATLLGDSGDINFNITTSWATYTFNYTVLAGADSIKFVPLMVVDPIGSSTGFDNIGVFGATVPEPTSMALAGLGAALLVIRRRK
jgi:hypothetical protein